MRCDRVCSTALSIAVSDGGDGFIRRPGFEEPDAIRTSDASDGALRAGYAAGAHLVPSPIARALVRVSGLDLALRLAPRLLLDAPGITAVSRRPGGVRLRCAGTAAGLRRRCLERQGMLLALSPRFG